MHVLINLDEKKSDSFITSEKYGNIIIIQLKILVNTDQIS